MKFLASDHCPEVTLRSLEHDLRHSNDSHYFSAHLYLKEKKIMRVKNEGVGGCHFYEPTNNLTQARMQELLDRAKLFCKSARRDLYDTICSSPHVDFTFVDVLVSNLVNEQLTTKSMQKELRNNIYIIDRDANEGKGYLYKTNKRPTDTHLKNANKLLTTIGKYFNYTILNELEEREQLRLWLTIN